MFAMYVKFVQEPTVMSPTPSYPRSLRLSYGQASSVLRVACKIPDRASSAFDSRIRQLQRLGVSVGEDAGKHARFAYGLTELAALATTFKLMSAFMAPTFAARYVIECWPKIAPAIVDGIGDSAPQRWQDTRPRRGGRFVIFEGAALADLGRKAAHEGRFDSPLGSIRLFAEADIATVALSAGGAGVVLDTGSYMPRIISEVLALPLVTHNDVIDELDLIRQAHLSEG
jgi:hypothetical protein